MFSRGVHAHPECPRQEEQAQLPHQYGSDVLSSTSVPPTAAEAGSLTSFHFVSKVRMSPPGGSALAPSCNNAPGRAATRQGVAARASMARRNAARRRRTCVHGAPQCGKASTHVHPERAATRQGADARASEACRNAARCSRLTCHLAKRDDADYRERCLSSSLTFGGNRWHILPLPLPAAQTLHWR